MARSKGTPPDRELWIGGSRVLSTLVLAVFAMKVGNLYDRLDAAAFCTLPVILVGDLIRLGLPTS